MPYIAWLDARRFFSRIFDNPSRLVKYILVVPLAMFIAGALLGFQNYFYFFVSYSFFGTSTLITPLVQLPAFIMEAIISWFVIWGLIEGLCYLNFKKKAVFAVSLAGCGLCALPVFCYELLVFLLHALSVEVPAFLSGVLLVSAQLVTVYFLVMFQMWQKGLKLEKSISIVLPAHYLSIFFYLLVFVVL